MIYMEPADTTSRIKARKRGNRAGILFFQILARVGGLSGAYGFLNFVCLYYLLVDRDAVRSTIPYVRRMFPSAGALRRRWLVYRLFVQQGKHLIDRYAQLGGHYPFQVSMDGREKLQALAGASHGMILLNSHVGNWQLVMGALDHIGKNIHLVMRPEDNAAVREAFQLDQEGGRIRVISIDAPFGGVVDIMNALQAGDVVCLMGDRPYDFDPVHVSFLGAPARFPYSSFMIAAMAEVPVVVLLSAKTAKNAYTIEVPAVYYPTKGARGRKQEHWAGYVQQYADELAGFLQRYPLQYFVFQDLWGAQDDEKPD